MLSPEVFQTAESSKVFEMNRLVATQANRRVPGGFVRFRGKSASYVEALWYKSS